VTVGELEDGLNAVAVPVRDWTDTVIAALSVSGPATRMPAGRWPDLVESLASTADDIAGSLGHRGSR
jgi:DNA-binding IclR family transcriptional regulator